MIQFTAGGVRIVEDDGWACTTTGVRETPLCRAGCPRPICQWQAGHGQPTDPYPQSGQFHLLPTA